MNPRANRYPNLEAFRRSLRLNPMTGDLVWGLGPRHGQIAGYITKKGYRHVTVEGAEVAAHRVVWAFTRGDWPSGLIDHENGDKSDNRPGNLRECDHRGNAQNTPARSNHGTGLRGAVFSKKAGRFMARIVNQRKCIYLGYYDTAEEAHAAYLTAKAELHTFQPLPRPAAAR